MDFKKQLTTPEGEKWTHEEKYKDESGVIKTRDIELTLFKVARESLLGKVGSRVLNSVPVTMWRWNMFNKINKNHSKVELSFFDKLLLKKLVSLRFDIAPAAQLINTLNGK